MYTVEWTFFWGEKSWKPPKLLKTHTHNVRNCTVFSLELLLSLLLSIKDVTLFFVLLNTFPFLCCFHFLLSHFLPIFSPGSLRRVVYVRWTKKKGKCMEKLLYNILLLISFFDFSFSLHNSVCACRVHIEKCLFFSFTKMLGKRNSRYITTPPTEKKNKLALSISLSISSRWYYIHIYSHFLLFTYFTYQFSLALSSISIPPNPSLNSQIFGYNLLYLSFGLFLS